MAHKDPEAYATFIKQNTSPEAAVVAAGTHIVPTAGFVVKTYSMTQERVAVQEVGVEQSVKRTKTFVNITSHEAIEPPKAPNGADVSGDVASADGLAIPLVVGVPRQWKCVFAVTVDCAEVCCKTNAIVVLLRRVSTETAMTRNVPLSTS
jgi:hypothetical protein